MIFRSLSYVGDWNFGAGKSSYAKTATAIKFNIETILKTFLGECFFDTTIGLPWFDLINLRDKDAVVLYIKSYISEIYGVIMVIDLEYTFDTNRLLTIKYEIETLYETNLLGTVTI